MRRGRRRRNVPFSFNVLFNEEAIGTPIVEPAVVTRRLLDESGMVERGTPVMVVRLGSVEYELRVKFRCSIGVRVAVDQALQHGALLASGGADGEELPNGGQYFSAHRCNRDPECDSADESGSRES